MRPSKLPGIPKPPPNAHHWMAWKAQEVINPGMDLRRVKKLKMNGPPREDGSVPDSWPVSEFSPKALLDTWGDGKYVVEWYEETGKRIRSTVYEVAKPAPPGAKLRGRKPLRSAEELEDDEPETRSPLERMRASGADGTMSIFDYLMLQREDAKAAAEREERLATRHREEALAAQERDRQFMGAIIATLKQPAAGGAADADLLRREMQLQIREGLHTIRKDIGQQLEQLTPDDEDPDDDDTPPKDLDEAAERIGQQLLGKLENVAPEVVEKIVPRVQDWLQTKFPSRGPRANGN